MSLDFLSLPSLFVDNMILLSHCLIQPVQNLLLILISFEQAYEFCNSYFAVSILFLAAVSFTIVSLHYASKEAADDLFGGCEAQRDEVLDYCLQRGFSITFFIP